VRSSLASVLPVPLSPSLPIAIPVFLHFVTVSLVPAQIIANCGQVKSLCLEEFLMSDTQVFIALAVALIPGLLAFRLSTELYK
jgi:photosystem I subunit XII